MKTRHIFGPTFAFLDVIEASGLQYPHMTPFSKMNGFGIRIYKKSVGVVQKLEKTEQGGLFWRYWCQLRLLQPFFLSWNWEWLWLASDEGNKRSFMAGFTTVLLWECSCLKKLLSLKFRSETIPERGETFSSVGAWRLGCLEKSRRFLLPGNGCWLNPGSAFVFGSFIWRISMSWAF